MKYMLQIYIVPLVDWYQHWRNRLSSFGGEANTNYYPSAKIICDGRTDTPITIWPPFGAITSQLTPFIGYTFLNIVKYNTLTLELTFDIAEIIFIGMAQYSM